MDALLTGLQWFGLIVAGVAAVGGICVGIVELVKHYDRR